MEPVQAQKMGSGEQMRAAASALCVWLAYLPGPLFRPPPPCTDYLDRRQVQCKRENRLLALSAEGRANFNFSQCV